MDPVSNVPVVFHSEDVLAAVLLRNVYFYPPIKKMIAVDASRDLLHL